MLNEMIIRKAQPREKKYKLSDSNQMYLEISPAGGKSWRLDAEINGKRQTLTIGKYPAISLKAARETAEEYRALIARGIDPREERKRMTEQAILEERKHSLLFETVALQWLDAYKQGRAATTLKDARGRLYNHVFPCIGKLPFLEIKRSDYAAILDKLPTSTPKSTGHKVASILKLIDDYGIDHYELPANRAQGLTRNIKADPNAVEHYKAIEDEPTLAHWLPILDNFIQHGKADALIRYAFKLLILTGVRISALLKSEWKEIDFERGVWVIPATHEKDGKPLTIYLSRQALDTFKALKQYHELYYDTAMDYVFPPIKGRQNPFLSYNTMHKAIKKVIPETVTTLHGWRTTLTTMCKLHGWPHSITLQSISHSKPGTSADHAYDRAMHEALKRKIMQWYADYLDALREGKALPVVDLNGGMLFGL